MTRLVAVAIALAPAAAGAAGRADVGAPAERAWRVSATSGAEYDAGVGGSTDEWYVPLAARFEVGAFAFGVATSWIRIEGFDVVGDVVINDRKSTDRLTPTTSDTTTPTRGDVAAAVPFSHDGIGDTLLSLSYAWQGDAAWHPFVEATVAVKLPTGSRRKLLSTGKTDWIAQLDLAKRLGRFTPFATVAYHRNGGPIEIEARAAATGSVERLRISVRDTVRATLGTSWRATDALLRVRGRGVPLDIGAMYDFRSAAVRGVSDVHELLPFATLELSEHLRLGPYFVVGLSRAAPEYGVAGQLVLSY